MQGGSSKENKVKKSRTELQQPPYILVSIILSGREIVDSNWIQCNAGIVKVRYCIEHFYF